GVFDFGCLVEVVQAQDEPRLVGQDGKGAAAPLRDAPEPEVGLEELACPPDVGDGQVEVIQTHGRNSSHWSRLIVRLPGPRSPGGGGPGGGGAKPAWGSGVTPPAPPPRAGPRCLSTACVSKAWDSLAMALSEPAVAHGPTATSGKGLKPLAATGEA